ncbi:hypothetical protein DPMN_163874 [Dreissena polymorpha]|uniref:Uncharacterized protein n=1 Tax=Dreissena polymorpha TaxID=45954 RepID=A0A9D4IT77_DREPO|nr:hypothetical protein DPMN_163874 [Dreissena polymorpha]
MVEVSAYSIGVTYVLKFDQTCNTMTSRLFGVSYSLSKRNQYYAVLCIDHQNSQTSIPFLNLFVPAQLIEHLWKHLFWVI